MYTNCPPFPLFTWLSGDQETQYTGLLLVARVDLSIPDLDQIFTAPSSPPVTMPAPSQLHLNKDN